MSRDTHAYGEVDSKTDLKGIFRDIRKEVETAQSRQALTTLYRRAGYLMTLTEAPSWEEKFGEKAAQLRQEAEAEFATTARKINRRAKEISTAAEYEEKWSTIDF